MKSLLYTVAGTPVYGWNGGVLQRNYSGPHLFDRIADATGAAQLYADDAGTYSFYWEIGNANGLLAAGAIGPTVYTGTTVMALASATKWLTGIVALETTNPADSDWPYLNFTSGYTNMTVSCNAADTVNVCCARNSNNVIDPAYVGVFNYGPGHLENFGKLRMGLGTQDVTALAATWNTALGSSGIGFNTPTLASGAYTTPNAYGRILQRLLRGEFAMWDYLDRYVVPASVPAGVVNTPAPRDEPWRYSVTHWIEPDGTYSSPGAFGFCPWIDASKTWYGIVAQQNGAFAAGGIGIQSAVIARSIRNAWLGT